MPILKFNFRANGISILELVLEDWMADSICRHFESLLRNPQAIECTLSVQYSKRNHEVLMDWNCPSFNTIFRVKNIDVPELVLEKWAAQFYRQLRYLRLSKHIILFSRMGNA